jgi:glycosyltransferase involved in cell wall biosynthesis
MVELHTDIYFRYLRSRNPALLLAGRLARHVLRHASRVRITGEALRESLEGAGVEPQRMAYVPYRVDTDFFCPDSVDRGDARRSLDITDALLVVSLGRFVPQKGFLELVQAFGRVMPARAIRLVIAGGGPLDDELQQSINEQGLGKRIRLLPWLSRERQRDLLAAADLYVQPSLPGKGEWMPRTILEAMAMGLPVVASNLGGIADVVEDGRNGILVEPGNSDALAIALRTVSEDGAVRRRLGHEGRRDAVASYNWDDAFARYRTVLYSLDGSTTNE